MKIRELEMIFAIAKPQEILLWATANKMFAKDFDELTEGQQEMVLICAGQIWSRFQSSNA